MQSIEVIGVSKRVSAWPSISLISKTRVSGVGPTPIGATPRCEMGLMEAVASTMIARQCRRLRRMMITPCFRDTCADQAHAGRHSPCGNG
jgi:hypothetical protein